MRMGLRIRMWLAGLSALASALGRLVYVCSVRDVAWCWACLRLWEKGRTHRGLI